MTNADLAQLEAASDVLETWGHSHHALALERCRKERALLLKAARDVIEKAQDGRPVSRRCSVLLRLKALTEECGEPRPSSRSVGERR